MKQLAIMAAALAASGCTTMAGGPGPGDGPALPAAISYETGPCFGTCPVYRVTVRADGSGTFEGRRFTAVTGTRSFTVTPAQYRAFAARLAPLRPATGSVRLAGEACRQMATDLPSGEVTWTGRDGAIQTYYLYFGCDMEKNRPAAERLQTAPSLLPIGQFIRPS